MSMVHTIFVAVLISAIVSAACSATLIPLFRAWKFLDDPRVAGRKLHRHPVVLVGGVAIVVTVAAALVATARFAPQFVPYLTPSQWVALTIASSIIFIFGLSDDKFSLPPFVQLAGPILAVAVVVRAGIVVSAVTNPFGGVIAFGAVRWVPVVLTATWLMCMMYGTKLLDGLDGLAAGMSFIAACMIIVLTHTAKFYEPRIGFVAALVAGACLGFLIFNFYPARAFLGEGGSLFLGFALGILAILSGSKIATTLLVMGVPVFDSMRVACERVLHGRSPFAADQQHLHHLFLRNGISHRTSVILYYLIGCGFGVSAFVLDTSGKIIMLGVLVCVTWGLAWALEKRVS